MAVNFMWQRKVWILAIILLFVLASGFGRIQAAPDPDSGTVSSASPTLTYTGGPFFTNNLSPQGGTAGVDFVCADPALPCDIFELEVDLTGAEDGFFDLVITHSWDLDEADYDIYLTEDGTANTTLNSAASSGNPEVITHCGRADTYNIVVVPFAPLGQTYDATVTLVPRMTECASGEVGPIGDGSIGLSTDPLDPRYFNYVAPAPLGQSAGEPSIGVNHNTQAAMFIAYLETLRVEFDFSGGSQQMCSSPATDVWLDKSVPTHVNTLDPILFTDIETGYTISSQLAGKTSIIGVSDDDGENWTPSQGAGINAGVDHQTIGGGPYSSTLEPPHPNSDHAVYYCSQDIALAQCARSDDNGVTFGAAVPIYNITECGGLHGHVKVSPADGSVYVANGNCGGQQGFSMSEDNGNTWNVRTVPDSTADNGSDPSVALASDGKVYFGYVGADGQPMVTTSTDNGQTWTPSIDVGVDIGIDWAVFPAMVAGDSDRAALMFIGSAGDAQGNHYEDTENFMGNWYVFVSHTYDGGATWKTINITPFDPVQRGSICNGGTTCGGDRNLLDFNDATLDAEGRMMIAYADGCVDGCVDDFPNSFTDIGVIARQEGGKRLYAAFDPVEPSVPDAPRVDSVTRNPASDFVTINWSAVNHGGSYYTGFNIFRSDNGGPYVKLNPTLLSPDKTTYIDIDAPSFDDSGPGDPVPVTYLYRVRARNAEGQGVRCDNHPVTAEAPFEFPVCVIPGVSFVPEPNDSKLEVADHYDIVSVGIAEPYDEDDPVDRLIFSMEVQRTNNAQPFMPAAASRYGFEFNYQGVDIFVELNTQAGEVYQYGHIDAGSRIVDGMLEAGSGYTPDGFIALVLPNDELLNVPGVTTAPGEDDTLVDVYGYAQDNLGLSLIDSTDMADYTLVGNLFCAPNEAPKADLQLSQMEVQVGQMVSADGTASDDADGDAIIEYEFIWGDGDTETNATGTATHSYDEAGEYAVRLFVTDERNAVSKNVARVILEVVDSTPTALAVRQAESGGDSIGMMLGIGLLTVVIGGTLAIVVTRRRIA